MDWYYTLIQCLGLFWTSQSHLQQKRDGGANFQWLNLLASLVPWFNWFNIFEQSLGFFSYKNSFLFFQWQFLFISFDSLIVSQLPSANTLTIRFEEQTKVYRQATSKAARWWRQWERKCLS